MFVHNQVAILWILMWVLIVYSTTLTRKRRWTLLGLFSLTIVLFYFHFRAQAQRRIAHAPVWTMEKLVEELQPGDLIFGASRYDLSTMPFFDKFRHFLNQTFCHSVIVMEHQGQKFVYHSLPDPFYKKYRTDVVPGYEEKYLVGTMQNNWRVLLEPLEMFLHYDGVVEGEIFEVARANLPIAYSPEINARVCAERDRYHVHCNVVTGLYLSFSDLIPKNNTFQAHSTYFMPEGILYDIKTTRRYDVKLW
jgi:hypothetical protein